MKELEHALFILFGLFYYYYHYSLYFYSSAWEGHRPNDYVSLLNGCDCLNHC